MISDRSSTCSINAPYIKVIGSLFKPIFTPLIIINSLLVALSHPWLQVPGYNTVIKTTYNNDTHHDNLYTYTHDHILITHCSHDVNYMHLILIQYIVSLLVACIFPSSIFL